MNAHVASASTVIKKGSNQQSVHLSIELLCMLQTIQQVNAEYCGEEASIEEIISEAISDQYDEAILQAQFHQQHKLLPESVEYILAIRRQLKEAVEVEPTEVYLRNLASLSCINLDISLLELNTSKSLVQISHDGIIVQCFTVPIDLVEVMFEQYKQQTDRWYEARMFQ